jgi:TRAP-type C4-dicarboxylate transport system substrate-binding protein
MPHPSLSRRSFAAGTAALLAAPALHAQDIRERQLRFAFSLAKDHPLGLGAQRFADSVAQRSGGKLRVNLFPGAVLGSDMQNLSAVRGGTLDFTSMATGIVASLEAYAIADGAAGTQLQADLAPHGIVGLGIWDLGFRHMTNSKRPIARAEDIAGLKIRVIGSPIFLDLFNALGANPVPMTFGEVYGALESRAIDGQDNPLGVIESAKFAEVQKYLSLTRHVYTGMPFMMGKKTWDALNEAERKVIREAADEARQFERQAVQRKEGESIDALRKSMQVNEVSAAEIKRLREKVQAVTDKFAREVGEPLVQQVHAELARLRGGQ